MFYCQPVNNAKRLLLVAHRHCVDAPRDRNTVRRLLQLFITAETQAQTQTLSVTNTCNAQLAFYKKLGLINLGLWLIHSGSMQYFCTQV